MRIVVLTIRIVAQRTITARRVDAGGIQPEAGADGVRR